MFSTAKRTLDNFIAFIEQFGFIPNGSRIYYLNRSHPPFFAQMLDMFYEFVSDSRELNADDKKSMKRFVLGEGLKAALREYEFWMVNRSVEVNVPIQGTALENIEAGLAGDDTNFRKTKKVRLNIYKADTDRPRPESYFEDINSVRNTKYLNIFILLDNNFSFLRPCFARSQKSARNSTWTYQQRLRPDTTLARVGSTSAPIYAQFKRPTSFQSISTQCSTRPSS
jgi:neutral trehalase